ncbi:MAG: restriction endonuclease subunit S [Microbacteriaceae bacterium]|nr:restriction endonuclease subunit S [Microbacteriaceae bacterium]
MMERVRLDDLCHIVVGRTPPRAEPRYWGGNHHWLSIADMTGQPEIHQTKERLSDEGAAVMRDRIAAPGTVLLSFKLSIGKVSIARVPVFTNEAIAALPIRDESRLDGSYLAHYLAYADLTGGADRAAMGNTLNLAKLRAIEVPVPPLPEQRRIASIFDQADQSVRAIESRLHLLAELESSVFFDIASRANAPRVPLADIAVTTSGGTPSRDVAEYYGPGYFWVKSGEVNQDIVLETEETITPAGLSNSSAKLMPAGTVLLAMYGATAGEVGLLGVEAATNQAVCCITPREDISAEYLVMALKAQRVTLKSLAVGGAQPNLSQGQIRTLPLPLLDSKDQAKLTAATRRIHDLKQKVQLQLRESTGLAKSLQHQAFVGAL